MIMGNQVNKNADSENEVDEGQHNEIGENFVDSPRQSKRVSGDKKQFYNDMDDSESETP